MNITVNDVLWERKGTYLILNEEKVVNDSIVILGYYGDKEIGHYMTNKEDIENPSDPDSIMYCCSQILCDNGNLFINREYNLNKLQTF